MAVYLKTIHSQTYEDVTYDLSVTKNGNVRCSCPAFIFGHGKECKHIALWRKRNPTWRKQLTRAKAIAEAE